MPLLVDTMPYPDIQKAAELINSGHTAEAVEMLLQARSQAPAYVTPRILLARAFTTLGNRQEAVRMWLEARALLPGNLKLADESILAADEAGGPDEPAALHQPFDPEEPFELGGENAGPPEEYPPAGRFDEGGEPFDPLDPEDRETGDATGEPEGPRAGGTDLDSLDDLIGQLENAPRITPKPSGEIDDEEFSAEPDEEEEIVSETLARIYVTQKQYTEAARVYAQLAEQQPDRSDEFLSKARECLENSEE